MKKYYLQTLIAINIFWAISALIYDIPAISHIPLYFWPFIIICPIFPALLAITWWQIYKKKKPDNYLLAFAIIPSIIYFIGALIFYPILMFQNGFNWLNFGQIFWVAIYGLQGICLLKKYPIKKSSIFLVTIFLLLSFVIQYFTKTYGYLDFSSLPSLILLGEYIILIIVSIFINTFYKR